MKYIGYNEKEFKKLKSGDIITYMVGMEKRTTTCISDAFYEYDADKPRWEVKTENCFLTINNDIWVQTADESLVSMEEIKDE